jgi:hypothetical protein
MDFSPSITQQGGSEPFELQVSRGQVKGHTPYFRFGWANSIGTTQQTIGSSLTAGSAYAYPSAATAMTVSSASANDTSAGTGVRTILVAGLDSNYARISETITMNGQTAVTTTKSYLRILYVEVLTYGSGAAAAGNIYIGTGTVTTGVPAVIYAQIDTTYNNFSFAGYTVPAGYTAYITSYTITSQSTTANINVSAALVEREFSSGGLLSEIQSTIRMVAGGNFDRHFDFPFVVEEKNDFELRAWATTGSAVNVTGEIQFVLIPNDVAV